MATPQSNPESGPQSPPPPYSTAITPPHVQCDEATRFQCEHHHATQGIDNSGAKMGQSAHGNEKGRTKEIDSPYFQDLKLEVDTEGGRGKWDTKRDMKRRWWMKKEDVKQKLKCARDDVISKFAMKGEDRSPSYARLIENEKAIENQKATGGVEVAGDKRSSKATRGKKTKTREYKRHTRAALAGDTDAAIMAGVVSLAILFTVSV